MSKFVIDAYAWIEYLNGSEKGKKVAKIVEGENECITSSATLAEVTSKFLRVEKDPLIALNSISSLSKITDVTLEIGVLAGNIHFAQKKKNHDFGMLDAFVAATSKKHDAKILTGDEDFADFKNAVFI